MWQFLLGAFLGGTFFGLIGFLIGYWVVQQGGAQEAGQVVGEHVEEHRDEWKERGRAVLNALFGGKRKFVWLAVFVVVGLVFIGIALKPEQLRTINTGMNQFVDGCGKTQTIDVTAEDVRRGYVILDYKGPCEITQPLGPAAK